MSEETTVVIPEMKDLSREFIERVALAAGKTLEDFDREVEELKSEILITQDVSSLAEATSFLIVNAEFTAQANAELITKVFELEARLAELEGNANA